MSCTAPNKINQLLRRNSQDASKTGEVLNTGEVLKLEFKAVHGCDAWDKEREEQLVQANAYSHVSDPTEARLLETHAWSVQNLPDPGQAALCLSGGGIRSAPFGLGILQGLARRSLLEQFHYLSTVS